MCDYPRCGLPAAAVAAVLPQSMCDYPQCVLPAAAAAAAVLPQMYCCYLVWCLEDEGCRKESDEG
jgi:hypothetical protein